MKLLSIIALAGLVNLTALNAGEEVCLPDCKTPVCCPKTGYIFAYAGYASPDSDSTRTVTGPGRPPVVALNNLDLDSDFIWGGGIGIYSDLFCGMRFEIEGIFTNHDATFSPNGLFGPLAIPDFAGDLNADILMFNALKEIPLNTPFGCLTGYIGGGVGVAWTDLDLNSGINSSDDDTTYALQLIAGVDIPVNDCVALFVQYKLLHLGETDYRYVNQFPGFANPTVTDISLDNYISHSVNAGVRLSF